MIEVSRGNLPTTTTSTRPHLKHGTGRRGRGLGGQQEVKNKQNKTKQIKHCKNKNLQEL